VPPPGVRPSLRPARRSRTRGGRGPHIGVHPGRSQGTYHDRPSRTSSWDDVLRSWIRVPVDTFFLVKSFVTLIVVIDPVSSVPLFLAMTDRYEPPALLGSVASGPRGRADHRGLRPVRPADPALPGDQAPELRGRRRSAAASGRTLDLAARSRACPARARSTSPSCRSVRRCWPSRARSRRSWCSCARPARRPSGSGRARAGRRARRAVADATVRGRGKAAARAARHRAGHPYLGLATDRDRGPARGRRGPRIHTGRRLTALRLKTQPCGCP
jgi:hypothetical protein